MSKHHLMGAESVYIHVYDHFPYMGSVAERSKALVLGTSLFGGVGSNPTAATGFGTERPTVDGCSLGLFGWILPNDVRFQNFT